MHCAARDVLPVACATFCKTRVLLIVALDTYAYFPLLAQLDFLPFHPHGTQLTHPYSHALNFTLALQKTRHVGFLSCSCLARPFDEGALLHFWTTHAFRLTQRFSFIPPAERDINDNKHAERRAPGYKYFSGPR